MRALDPRRTALVLVDMQNDFLHPDGAYARGGLSSPAMEALAPRLANVAEIMRTRCGWIVATQFTLVPGRGGAPFISAHLRSLRPFLGAGDFAPGTFGHDIIEALKPADLMVEKVGYDAFYMSRLEWVLRRARTDALVFGGIVTNGGVESTVRAAHVRGFESVVLDDGCAAFSEAAHAHALHSMQSVAHVASCAQVSYALAE